MNLATDPGNCFKKLKAKVLATSRKFPGFFKFSGYKQVRMLCPDVIMTKGQMRKLIDETFEHFSFYRDWFANKIDQVYPPSTQGLPKSKHT